MLKTGVANFQCLLLFVVVLLYFLSSSCLAGCLAGCPPGCPAGCPPFTGPLWDKGIFGTPLYIYIYYYYIIPYSCVSLYTVSPAYKSLNREWSSGHYSTPYSMIYMLGRLYTSLRSYRGLYNNNIYIYIAASQKFLCPRGAQ